MPDREMGGAVLTLAPAKEAHSIWATGLSLKHRDSHAKLSIFT